MLNSTDNYDGHAIYLNCKHIPSKHVQRAEVISRNLNFLGGMPLAGASLSLHSSIATWLLTLHTNFEAI